MDRSKLATVLDKAKIPTLLLGMRSRGASPWITVLTYHRAADPGGGAFDDGVVDTTPEAFDKQIAFVKEWFDLITIDDLVCFRRGEKLPKNPLLVTFDDGYLDNHDTVLPILKKHGAHAVFFIATHYIDERRLFWWDKISYILKRSKRAEVRLGYPREEALPLGEGLSGSIKRALRIVKDHHGLDLDRYLEELGRAAGVELSRDEERKIADAMLMTWDQIRALRRAGMDVQSHTSTHRVLQTVPEHLLANELAGSRARLEAELGEKILAVSYPVGKPMSLTPHVRRAVREAGYELGFSNGTGINHTWGFDPLDIRRISLDADLSDAFFRAMVALPYLAY